MKHTTSITTNQKVASLAHGYPHAKRSFNYKQAFKLESGNVLHGFHLTYETFGSLNKTKNNAVWVFHALTGDSNPTDWWSGLVGNNKSIDPKHDFIICVNMPGSHYGSINPLSINTESGKSFLHEFPLITTRDMANMYSLLQQSLGINKVKLGIGGSMGGMQLLEWSILQPKLFKNIVLIATNAQHSPWGIAFNETQRMAIENDPTWMNSNPNGGSNGLATARAIAMLSYRNYMPYQVTQHETSPNSIDSFKASSYQQYQGTKLTNRFNAHSYYTLTKSMDAHNVGRSRESVEAALQLIEANTIIVGIESDLLFPIAEQRFLANNIRDAKFETINSIYGHDGFLVEYAQLSYILKKHLKA